MIIVKILLLVLILGIIIMVHEFGHFIWAKIFKVHIYEFSLGMGPVIFSHKGRDNIDYNVRAFPIGGFVSMAGEVYEDDETVAKEKLLCNRPWLQRLIIMVAGVTNNFILAIIILFFIGTFTGATVGKPIVKNAEVDYPAYKAGIKDGDKILKINGYKVYSWDRAQILLLYKDKDNKYEFEVKHKNGKKETIKITPVKEKDADGNERSVFGFAVENKTHKGVINGLKYGVLKFASIYDTMFLTIWGLISGHISVNALSGPVGMYGAVGTSLSYGFASLIYLVAFLSINVGFINILPFPAFDGGHVFFMIIEKIKGSPVNQKIENTIHTIGFILILILMLYVTVMDIIRLF